MKFVLTLLVLAGLVKTMYAQNTDKEKNNKDIPKVGLVLSGGGAKGLAHIGVLKVIDELGIRLDYISGSSIGAVVGGLYASGYSGKQLDSLFKTLDFNKLIQDKLPRNSKTFYEKEDSEKYAVTLPVIDKKIGLPKGISNGQNFYNFYSKLTTHVRGINDFSKLPIPFFCTATNIETGKGIVFDKGYLPEVVVASGALPSVYSPVMYNNQLITDGGITDNYPVEEIRKRGVELVIGVDVQDTLMNRKELGSLTDVMLQINNFRTISAMKTKRSLTDVFVRPNVKRFSVVSFDDGEEIIKEGEDAVEVHLETLKKIAEQQANKGVQKRKGIIPVKNIKIDKITIDKNVNYSRAYIKAKLKLRKLENINLDKLNKGLDNLYATKNFQNIRYKILSDSLGGNTLKVTVNEQKIKSYFRFGLHYDNLYKAAAIVNYTKKNLFYQNDVLSFDAILGEKPRYTLDYYIDKGFYWSVGIHHRLYRYDRKLPFDFVRSRRDLPNIPINFLDIEYLDITSQLYIETLLNQSFAFRLGVEHKLLKIETDDIGLRANDVVGTTLENINLYSFYSNITFDSLNNKYFPSKGLYFKGSFSAYPLSSKSTEEFDEFAVTRVNFNYAKSFGNHMSLVGELAGGVRFGRSDNTNPLDFFLGGFGSRTINNQIPFYGRDFLELSGDSFVKSALTFDYKFAERHHLNATANYANIGSKIFDINNWFERIGFSGYAVGYGYDSILGPIQLKYSFTTDSGVGGQFLVSVGYWF